MKVLLHGATNLSNYGDYLFAELFYRALIERSIQPEFYGHPVFGISDFFSRHLGYQPSKQDYRKNLRDCDALVYFSGGYFGEPTRKGLRAELRHTHRFLSPAKHFMRHGKPIYLLGIGAGPFSSALFSRQAKKILAYAEVVTVRNERSAQACRECGIQREVTVTADTALVLKEFLEKYKTDVKPFDFPKDKKMLLLHIDSNPLITQKIRDVIRPAVLKFLRNHTEYRLVLASDGLRKAAVYEAYRNMFADCDPISPIYDDPWELTRIIERADLILTPKLHMGIVGSVFGASVLAFPYVPEKTGLFYQQLGEADRCVPLTAIDSETAFAMMERYRESRISVPPEMTQRAKQNLLLLPHNH